MNSSKKDCHYVSTPLHESIYVENNFAGISSQKTHLVSIHGLGTYSGWFNELCNEASEKQISSTAFDLPGFGRSGTRGEVKSYHSWIEALKAVWSQAHEKNESAEMFLLGHSLGGIVALASLKELNPKPKGVILTVPGFVANPKSWSILEFILPTLFKALDDSPEKTTFPFPPEVYESIKKGMHQMGFLTPEVKPKLLLEILNMTNIAWLACRNFHETPLLMVLPEHDPFCVSGASKIFFNLCNSPYKTLKIFPEAGHDLFILPEAEETNHLIVDWIGVLREDKWV